MIDEEIDELNLMLIVDRKFWFPLRVPCAACHLDSGAWGLDVMVQYQVEARKMRGESNVAHAQEMDAAAEEIRAWLVRRSGLTNSVPDLAARQRINPQVIRGERNMRRYIYRLLDLAQPAPLGAAMDVLLLSDLDEDSARLYSSAPNIAKHAGRYVVGEQVSQGNLRRLACAAVHEAINGNTKGE